MTSIKRAGRIATFGFAVGAGLLIASGAGAAVAAAAPDDAGHTSTTSSSASSARTHRPAAANSTGTSAKPKPARTISSTTDSSAPVVQMNTGKRTPAAASALKAVAPAASDTTTPTASVKQSRAQRLPTPAEVQQAIVAGLDAARRDLDTLRRNVELLVKHQIEGIRDNLTTLRYDLEAIVGPNRQPEQPDIPADDTPGLIGNPADKEVYFVPQGDTNRCVLMSTAMVIGQLRGIDNMPTAQQITDEAATTPSTVKPGKMIYDPIKDTYVAYADALALLEAHGITATSTQFSKGQGTTAVDNLKTALTAGESVIVTINANIAWGRAAPGGAVTADHAITVLGIDTVNDIVYVNDSAFETKGQGMAVKLNVFMSAWAANDYQTITAHLTPAIESTIAA
ncbi:conserved exported hypothetical protein [uncultured Mycobacterium sp.]|uniref:Peptidase C39-like domain-containing protein n=1 Tax=uncultured Mycobacterium sp. TaxID=171292 RepID=A0A1Y5PIU4_9MYCO|nr:conserved exported hypothetical protein [uncultured Mycobacterium sp.]